MGEEETLTRIESLDADGEEVVEFGRDVERG